MSMGIMGRRRRRREGGGRKAAGPEEPHPRQTGSGEVSVPDPVMRCVSTEGGVGLAVLSQRRASLQSHHWSQKDACRDQQ